MQPMTPPSPSTSPVLVIPSSAGNTIDVSLPDLAWLAIDVIQHLGDECLWVLGVEAAQPQETLPGMKAWDPGSGARVHVFSLDGGRSPSHRMVRGLFDKDGWAGLDANDAVAVRVRELLAEFAAVPAGAPDSNP